MRLLVVRPEYTCPASFKKEDLPGTALERIVRKLPREKRYRSMPAAKIGRPGVSVDHGGQDIGAMILDFLKYWFSDENKTGCRYLLVDAYNTDRNKGFYKKNGFSFLTSKDEKDDTGIMYFDLITFRE